MLIRSLTLATLLVAAGTALAADSDGPLAQERGKSRPLIIIAPSTLDPTLVSLKKALEEPANREAFVQRNMVLYTVVNTIGERDGKALDPQSTMALIRELKLGAGVKTRVILVGKDGEKKIEKSESIDPKEIFATIDQMPMREKEAAAPAPVPEAKPVPAEKPGKPVKGAAPGKTLDD
ncbi:DUF4174 domain-containing protein [Pseudomonas cannabina]|uniref:DUF4174 domain-containing protein n=3 Tax=Pseudomonas syringae group TaxID=136849 RepID=A0A3M3QXJ8_PSECA|nr:MULTISPECIES: DUF4174 domain-containing protein [Pseudomonas syringae group]KPB77296.1 Uncharacterized protein AC507_4890 [Pseudomonas syringae pv. maculicola]KPW17333.1 Uncharacterized protein ALO83_00758 [Pseudomonas cannabina pv. alisalensis]MBM0140420.1 DUF4174 domain-containing protein [Pseudomonas cannabina pv. alisalensis]QHE97068.1 DUF4174 domain-containing protein [Pseudomonas syringae pv. maculicola str. ES4326]QQN19854.1 DUF4174 domain-containing protein [Pseudomonas cannabina pv